MSSQRVAPQYPPTTSWVRSVVGLLLVVTSNRLVTAQQDPLIQVIGQAVENPETYADVRTAVNRFRNRDFDGARELFVAARQENPELPPAGTMLGRLFMLANDGEGTRNALTMAVRTDPSDPEAYAMLGDMLQKEGYDVPAEVLYQRSLALANELSANQFRQRNLVAAARLGLASLAERRGDWASAGEQLQAVAQADNQNVPAVLRLARAVFMAKPTDESSEQMAFRLLEEVGKHVKLPASPQVQMASFAHQLGNHEKAKLWFQRALEFQPDDVATRLAVVQWAFDAGDIDFARENVDKALTLDPDSFDALMMSGMTARYEKDYDHAQKLFERCHLMRPDEFQPLNQLALSLIDVISEASQKKALAYGQIASRLQSDLTTRNGRDAAVTMGWLLFLSDRGTEAQTVIQQALARGPVSPESRYLAARVLYDVGQSDEARSLLGSLDGKPGNAFPTLKEAEQLRQRLK